MNHNKRHFLSIAPFTKRIGYAVFHEGELYDYAVKTLKPPRTPKRIKAQISAEMRELFSSYKPEFILLKKISARQMSSVNLKAVYGQIKRDTDLAGIPLLEISLRNVKKTLCFGSAPTKENTFTVLKEVYPELERFIDPDNPSQTEYYNSLLSAVALSVYRHIRLVHPFITKKNG